MKPGAELWLVTPNGEANLRPITLRPGAADGGLPLLDQGHLSFFSGDHLNRLFEECGYDVLSARAIGVRRGLKALGWLPGQRRFARHVTREPERSADEPDNDEVRVVCPTRRSGRGVASPMDPRLAAVLPAPSALEATRRASGLDGRGIRLRVLVAPPLESPFASGLRPMQECRYVVFALDSLGHLCCRYRGRRCDEPVRRNGARARTE